MSTWKFFSNLFTNLKEKIYQEEEKRCQRCKFQPI